jgi:hypothetical protein
MSKHDGDMDTGGAPLSGENYSSFPTSGVDPLGYDESNDGTPLGPDETGGDYGHDYSEGH